MSWMDAISDIVKRYSGAGAGAASAPADPHQDYQTIAQSAPCETMAEGLAHTFRSDQTPSFPEMVSRLFKESDPEQRAGLLNHIIAAVGPAVMSRMPGLKQPSGAPAAAQSVTPQMANQVSPEEVKRVADYAQQSNPTIIDQVSNYYAQHPGVIKALGGAAIAIAIQHITRRTK